MTSSHDLFLLLKISPLWIIPWDCFLSSFLPNIPSYPSFPQIQALVNAPSAKGFSALLSAADQGHVGIVKMLLNNNARVDVFDTGGNAALHLAAAKGFEPVSCTLQKSSRLHLVKHNKLNMITPNDIVVQISISPPIPTLVMKIHKFLFEEVSFLFVFLDWFPMLHLMFVYEFMFSSARRDFYWSIFLQVCESLLAHKAFVNARNVKGLTALHLASMEGYNDLVRNLIVTHAAQKDSLSLVREQSCSKDLHED